MTRLCLFYALSTGRTLGYVLFLFALVMLSPGGATELSCQRNRDATPAIEPAVAKRVCRVLDGFHEQLADCALAPFDGVTFQLVDSLAKERGDPLAAYDASSDLIKLMLPNAVDEALTAHSPYSGVPPAALYDSLIVHELAHAYVARLVPRGAQYPMAHEYVSYVLQLSAMPAAAREMLLMRFPKSGPVKTTELNLFVAQAAPVRFGVKAWRHFTQPDSGCETLHRILRGEPVFPRED